VYTAVSLFAGIGGFELAMSRVGIHTVASVEIDPKASGVLTNHFPNSRIFSDVKGVTSEQLFGAGFDSKRGIITGGFPCQDLSVAGRRAGLAGERSGLFWEIHRLLAETRSEWFVLENVPGLLSSNDGRDMGTVLSTLGQLGYGVAYRVLDAQHFGVAQRRRRVFIVGRLGNDWRTPAKILDIGEGRRGYIEAGFKARKDTTRPSLGGAQRGGLTGSELVGTLAARDYKGVSSQYIEENKVIPFVKVVRSGARDLDGNLPPEVWARQDVAPTLNLMDNTGETRATVVALQNTVLGRSDTAGPQGRGHSDEEGPMFTLDTTSPHGIVFHPHRSDGARVQGDTINTLTSFMGTGGLNTPMVASTVVRRLTPVECERLQGFPDNWTEFSGSKAQADSSRYKQTGNAVAVPVVQWIMDRLVRFA
jgi:DNA (cytosine-5)-methyltransferase 1